MQVVTMITKNYLWLALIAALIAFPVAWYFMNNWLQIFPYNAGYHSAICDVCHDDLNYCSRDSRFSFSKSCPVKACKKFKN